MSQVGLSSRPASVAGQKAGLTLPQIEHPLSRMSNPGNMDIRGVSRAGDRPGSHPTGRFNENVDTGRKVHSAMGRTSRLSGRNSQAMNPRGSFQIETIPEGCEVVHGDPNKTRMPIFVCLVCLIVRKGNCRK
ncbi:hypothetical protein KUTeg_003261 [Tegillarca granosa]|uniref:Uncharacterized protein n=1 Tax=Tegillarca granosa TaxID=220873 RepID=A0ABQ9FLM6_TEGGR|nr:hypothetical protein KUTeg_003261 [Tegillarca granosa]